MFLFKNDRLLHEQCAKVDGKHRDVSFLCPAWNEDFTLVCSGFSLLEYIKQHEKANRSSALAVHGFCKKTQVETKMQVREELNMQRGSLLCCRVGGDREGENKGA